MPAHLDPLPLFVSPTPLESNDRRILEFGRLLYMRSMIVFVIFGHHNSGNMSKQFKLIVNILFDVDCVCNIFASDGPAAKDPF